MKKIKTFVNDGKVYYKAVQKKDAIQAAEAWGEGFDPLISLLETCIKNGITTMACCAGHIRNDSVLQSPYIVFEDQHDITNYLLEKMLEEESLDNVLISRNKMTNTPSVAFYGSYQNKRDFFTIMLQHIHDYVYTNGPLNPSCLKDFVKVLNSKRSQKENPYEKSTLSKILDIMRTSNLKRMISYTPHTNIYEVISSKGEPLADFLEEDIEEYLLSIAEQETEKQGSSVMQIVKDMCRNTSTRINEIQEIARKLCGKIQNHNPDMQTEKQELEK